MEAEFLHGQLVERMDTIEGAISEIRNHIKDHNASDIKSFAKIDKKMDKIEEFAKSSSASAYSIANNMKERGYAIERFEKMLNDHIERVEEYLEEHRNIIGNVKDRVLVMETNEASRKTRDAQRITIISIVVGVIMGTINFLLKK